MAEKKSLGKKLKNFSFDTRLKSTEAYKERLLAMFKNYIKAIVMFGSITRNQQHGKSDVDIYVIFDDTKMPLKKFDEIRDKITNDMYKVAKDIDPRLHPQPVIALTEFIDGMRKSSPLFYTLTRDGYAVYDSGFFIPMRKLLEWGRFPATSEAAYLRMDAVPKRIERVKDIKKLMIAEDIYYAMLDAAQAILMYVGVGPPAPSQAASEMRKHLVANKLLDEKYAKMMEDAHIFRKKLEYKELEKVVVSGKEVDEWIVKAEDYVKEMEKLLKKIEGGKKNDEIKRNYDIMIKATVAALKAMKKLPEDPKELPDAFKKHLIEEKQMNPIYSDMFTDVIEMRKKLDDKNLEEVTERDIYLNREYVRRFVNELRNILEHPEEKTIEQKADTKMEEAKATIETAKEIKKLPMEPKKKRGKK